MCSSNPPPLRTLFSIFLLFSTPNVIAATPSSSSMLKDACNNRSFSMDTNLCLHILQSDPKITSAKNSFDLVVAIIESGISNATNTHSYIRKKLKEETTLEPALREAFVKCNESYYSAVRSFTVVLAEVRDDKEYRTADYDLAIATSDDIRDCSEAVASKGFKDGTVLSGFTALKIYGFAARNAMGSLWA